MRIVTWNVNSLKARLPRVTEWIDEVRPEVLCLQETKMADEAFPALDFEALGYTGAHFGQGRWNGVAIISRVGLDDVVANFAPGIEPDTEARIITATCGGVRVSSVYVPNGRAVDDPHYFFFRTSRLVCRKENAWPSSPETARANPPCCGPSAGRSLQTADAWCFRPEFATAT